MCNISAIVGAIVDAVATVWLWAIFARARVRRALIRGGVLDAGPIPVGRRRARIADRTLAAFYAADDAPSARDLARYLGAPRARVEFALAFETGPGVRVSIDLGERRYRASEGEERPPPSGDERFSSSGEKRTSETTVSPGEKRPSETDDWKPLPLDSVDLAMLLCKPKARRAPRAAPEAKLAKTE